MTLTLTEWSDLRANALFSGALARICKELRAESWTQEAFASQAGVHVETIRRIEQGRINQISIQKLSAFAAALGVSIEDLVARAKATPAGMNLAFQFRGIALTPPIGRDGDRDAVALDLMGSRGVVLYGAPGLCWKT